MDLGRLRLPGGRSFHGVPEGAEFVDLRSRPRRLPRALMPLISRAKSYRPHVHRIISLGIVVYGIDTFADVIVMKILSHLKH